MSASVGISLKQGTFVLRKKVTKKGLAKHEEKKTISLFGNDESGSESAEIRFENFKKCWKNFEENLKNLREEIFKTVFSDLLLYLKKHEPSRVAREEGEINCAALLTGVNMPDHDVIFGYLADRLRRDVTPHVALAKSENCRTVKLLVQKVIAQFLDQCHEEKEETAKSEFGLKKNEYTLTTLKAWYHNKYDYVRDDSLIENDTTIKSNKRRKSFTEKKVKRRRSNSADNKRPNLVVIIEDFEGFSVNVLKDFIILIKDSCMDLPFVFVFGISTFVSVIHKMLPYQVIGHLAIEKFSMQSASKYLGLVVEKLLLSNENCFKLSQKVFNLLIDVFICHNFSIKNFSQFLKFCVLQHYTSSSISCLCVPREDLDDRIDGLSDFELQEIMQLESVKKELQALSPTHRNALKDEKLRKYIKKGMKKLYEYNHRFILYIKVLFEFIKDLPRAPLGKQIRELYSICLGEHICTSSGYREAFVCLKMLSKIEMLKRIQDCVELLKNNLFHDKNFDHESVVASLESFVEKLEDVERIQQEMEEEHDRASKKEDGPNSSKILRLDFSPSNAKLSRFDLQRKLLESLKEDKIPNAFEKIRSEVMKFFQNLFNRTLEPPSTRPFHEILYFANANSVKRHFVGYPRPAIQTALSDPGRYLDSEDLVLKDKGDIPASLPFVSIAYKLHLECGRLINMYDWLQCWLSIIEPGKRSEQREIGEDFQARFIQAVSELQLLGFIKPSRRKTDHLQRLTWGGC